MKELSIEEKAKRYDEAIKRARKLATDLPNGRNDRLYHVWDLETIFPELKESEDGKESNITQCIDKAMIVCEIEKRIQNHINEGGATMGVYLSERLKEDCAILSFLDTIQKEQPEDIVVTAKTFLDALSKTPYNNKPITDAQIIVKQLLLFFENPKEYNPDAILEQPEVDLEKGVKDILNQYYYFPEEPIDIPTVIRITAKHFYELGLKAMKRE